MKSLEHVNIDSENPHVMSMDTLLKKILKINT